MLTREEIFSRNIFYKYRPICCGKEMRVKSFRKNVRTDDVTVFYICTFCKTKQKAYLTNTGDLHPNQEQRVMGRPVGIKTNSKKIPIQDRPICCDREMSCSSKHNRNYGISREFECTKCGTTEVVKYNHEGERILRDSPMTTYETATATRLEKSKTSADPLMLWGLSMGTRQNLSNLLGGRFDGQAGSLPMEAA